MEQLVGFSACISDITNQYYTLYLLLTINPDIYIRSLSSPIDSPDHCLIIAGLTELVIYRLKTQFTTNASKTQSNTHNLCTPMQEIVSQSYWKPSLSTHI